MPQRCVHLYCICVCRVCVCACVWRRHSTKICHLCDRESVNGTVEQWRRAHDQLFHWQQCNHVSSSSAPQKSVQFWIGQWWRLRGCGCMRECLANMLLSAEQNEICGTSFGWEFVRTNEAYLKLRWAFIDALGWQCKLWQCKRGENRRFGGMMRI